VENESGSGGDSLRIKRAYFLKDADWGADKALPLREVDPVVLSEVLGTLAVVASKGA
jgi:hypothetical protein